METKAKIASQIIEVTILHFLAINEAGKKISRERAPTTNEYKNRYKFI